MKATYYSRDGAGVESGGSAGTALASPRETVTAKGLEGSLREVVVEVLLPEGHPPDLVLWLQSPRGEELCLTDGRGVARTGPCRLRFEEEATRDFARAYRAHEAPIRPCDSFSRLDGHAPNGTWTLRAEGTALRTPLAWSLELETGHHVFRGGTLRGQGADELRRRFEVGGLAGLVVDSVRARVRVTLAGACRIRASLMGPDGEIVRLTDDLALPSGRHTLSFSDEFTRSPELAARGEELRGRPHEGFARFQGHLVEGPWTLVCEDLDAGQSLRSLSGVLEIFSAAPHAPVGTAFPLRVRFHGGLGAGLRALVRFAALQWSELLLGPHAPVHVDGEEIEGLLLEVSGRRIDGGAGVLGEAGPTHLRAGSLLPAKGKLMFDSFDLARMERDGTAYGAIVHQVGHVLGLGTLLKRNGYLRQGDSGPWTFIGSGAMIEYARLLDRPGPVPVPLEEGHGGGARTHHWREEVFGNELMTSHPTEGAASSRVTLAALADLGFHVDLDRADPFHLAPRSLRFGNLLGHACATHPPESVVLEPSDARGSETLFVEGLHARRRSV